MDGPNPSIPVPEIRDYRRINAELTRLLDEGHTAVTLVGVERQRLLVSGLSGNWRAIVHVDGPAGPELGADVDAPNLTIIAPEAADGAGRGFVAGRLLIRGRVGDAVGYGQKGGVIVVMGEAGHRAGLMMEGGTLVLLDRVGRLCGDRQSGGRIFARSALLGTNPGWGWRGGRLANMEVLTRDDADALAVSVLGLEPWLSAREGGS